ncbi:LuxR C-terminal-related transcriptional regulator [Kitasatospora sp. NPDC127111]|uniref:LuxR C-terminal-related transcriptional regulator n=1 Tax=Kitasatospora sp. NPDC127111 TaxID=3345363 RepID=UPI00362880EA
MGTALYAYAVGRDSVSIDELVMVAGGPEHEARAAVAQLLDLRLLRATVESADRLVAVPPATAGAQVLIPAIRELHDRQQEISRVYSELTTLMAVYEDNTLGSFENQRMQYVTDLAAVRQIITELSARATSEVLTSQPGGARPESELDEAVERTTTLLERGVRMRTLYQHAAQFSRPTIEHVRMLAELGAEVRTVSDAFMRLIVFDRVTAILSLHNHPQGALVVREPSIVDFAVQSFERAWAEATEFPTAYERDNVVKTSDEVKQALVRLLVEGYEDRVIAKRLGISLRTYQRHLSEVMRRIGARSRAHAGYLLHKAEQLEQAEQLGRPEPTGPSRPAERRSEPVRVGRSGISRPQ